MLNQIEYTDVKPRSVAYLFIVAIKISFAKLNARTIRRSGWLIICVRSTDHTNYQTVFVFAFSSEELCVYSRR